MFAFLADLAPLHKAFWYVALFSSLLFIIQSILTFIGGLDADGISADFDGGLDSVDAPFQLFSLRNLVNFLLGFGWTGVVFYPSISSPTLLVLLATAIGVIFIFIFFVLIKQILKLSEDNTLRYENLIDKTGQVYLSIPGGMTGRGIVQISYKGSFHELEAMTHEVATLKSGATVRVDSVEEEILIVVKIDH